MAPGVRILPTVVVFLLTMGIAVSGRAQDGPEEPARSDVAAPTLGQPQSEEPSAQSPPQGNSAPATPQSGSGATTQQSGSNTTTQQGQQNGAHPTPMHTGLAALAYTTWDDFKAFPRRESTWVILGIGGGLALAAVPIDDEVNDDLMGSKAADRFWALGNVIGSTYTQVGVSVGLYVIGRYIVSHNTGEPKTNKWSHMGFDLLRAQIVSQSIVQGIKVSVQRDRPTGECCSFPSGHSASAFAMASVIERHFGYRFAWPTVAVATYVGTSRLHDNRHFLSDVLFGAAIGTATGWTVVGRHGRSTYALTPVPIRGGVAIQLSRTE